MYQQQARQNWKQRRLLERGKRGRQAPDKGVCRHTQAHDAGRFALRGRGGPEAQIERNVYRLPTLNFFTYFFFLIKGAVSNFVNEIDGAATLLAQSRKDAADKEYREKLARVLGKRYRSKECCVCYAVDLGFEELKCGHDLCVRCSKKVTVPIGACILTKCPTCREISRFVLGTDDEPSSPEEVWDDVRQLRVGLGLSPDFELSSPFRDIFGDDTVTPEVLDYQLREVRRRLNFRDNLLPRIRMPDDHVREIRRRMESEETQTQMPIASTTLGRVITPTKDDPVY